jgi:hypothetical protein
MSKKAVRRTKRMPAGSRSRQGAPGRNIRLHRALDLGEVVKQLNRMSVNRYTEAANIKAAERRRILAEVNQLADGIGRCEKTIASVMADLTAINAKFQGPRSTKDEVEFLKVLLDCAKKKLAWEKQIAALKKRAPAVVEAMTGIISDKEHPPSAELTGEMLRALQLIQSALQRLQTAEAGGA